LTSTSLDLNHAGACKEVSGGRFGVVACIPAYNEERSIAKTILQTQRFVDRVIVVDDGSEDMTATISERLGATVIRNDHKGKGSALRAALTYARLLDQVIVVTMDADGQHDPAEIPSLIAPIREREAEMVVGSRYLKESVTDLPSYRRMGLRLVNLLSRRSCNGIVKDTQCGFRAYSAKALEVLQQCKSNGFEIETEQLSLISKSGLRVAEVPVTVSYKGLENTSKQNPVKHGSQLVASALRLIIEERPLLLLGAPGALFGFTGIVTGIYVLLEFNVSRYFSMPMALVALGTIILGSLLSVASLIIYAIARLRDMRNR
jgi:glycosyltransferase involved in cell wall biosynthesis